jgi:APA family basic amino acid/polyamine antiporter
MQPPIESRDDAKLERALGVPSLTANIVNTTVGASIFVLPALVAAMLGAGSPLAFLVCAVAMGFVVTSFAIAGSRVSLTGGLYAYVEVAFGRYIGFLAGVLFLLTAILSVSGVVSIFADTVAATTPVLATKAGHFIIVLLVFGSLAWINLRGVRAGARAVDIVTVVKLAPLVVFVCVGIFFVRRADALTMSWPGTPALGQAVLLLIFAFAGIEVALVPSGEIKNPARTVPRAIYFALAGTTLLYFLIQLVAQGILGADLAKYKAAPLAEAAAHFLGHPGRVFLLVGATISAFGFVTSDILSSPRMLFAFGRDRFLPKQFAHVHSRFHTPDVAIVGYCVICFVLSLISTFQQLAVLANVAVLVLYFLCCAAALELMRRDVRTDGTPFTFPGAWIVPVIALVMIVWILAHATSKEFFITAACLVVASLIYLLQAVGERRLNYAAFGGLIGGSLAFLLRPSVMGYQLPLDVIWAGGATTPMADTSFNFLLAGTIAGGLLGLGIANLASYLDVLIERK